MSVDCGDGEPIDVDTQRRVRARKEHRCHACKENIERGHLYVRHTLIYAHEVDETIRCLRCDAIYQQLVEIHRDLNERAREEQRRFRENRHVIGYERSFTAEQRGLLYHEPEWPDLALNCGHEFTKRWGREPPPELARLAFMTPAELQAEALAKMAVKP
jgi:hypothetical protein